jgi:hypothetical protein
MKPFSSQLNDSRVKKFDIWREFYKCNPRGLNKHYNIPKDNRCQRPQLAGVPVLCNGGPVKLFTDCKCSSKIKKRQVPNPEEVSFAKETSLRAARKSDAADIKELLASSSARL